MKTKKTSSLADRFLIAMPSMEDPLFARSVIYLYEHDEAGATGMIINKPLQQLSLGRVLEHLHIETTSPDVESRPVLSGGPVGLENGFVIFPHKKRGKTEFFLSSSKEMLREIAAGAGPKEYLITLGYASWEPGQLEAEIINNDWFIASPSSEIFFTTPFQDRWSAAAAASGINFAHLSPQVGHA